MKKIFATIFIFSLACAVPCIAQKQESRLKQPAKTGPKITKAIPVNKVEAKVAVTPKSEAKAAKPVSKVAAAKLAHEQKVSPPAIKVVPVAKTEATNCKVVAAAPMAQEEDMSEVRAEAKYDSVLCFPLKKDNIYSLYTFVIDLRDKNIIRQYKPMFDRNNYAFTGYVWQGLLKQMINNADEKIMKNVFIKAEDNLVCFTITRFEVQHELPEYICPILSSPARFASYVRKANREDINNY